MARVRCLFALLVAHSTLAVAAPNQWSPTGPEGGPAWSIEYATATPGVALATTGHAIYRTTDNGVTWTEARPLSITNLVNIARDPGNPNRLVAIGPNSIPLRTEDGGQTFTVLPRYVVTQPNGHPFESVIAIAPNGVWYGGTSHNAVLRSIDQGATWELRSSGLPSTPSQGIQRILIDPRNADRVYVLIGSTTSNLYSTVNGGMSWAPHAGVCGTGCVDIALDPNAPDELLVASGNGLYASSNAGQTWTQRDARAFSTVRFDPVVAGRVLALALNNSITRSTDGGQSWSLTTALPITAFGNLAAALTFDPLQADRVMLGTFDGIFASVDGGTTWVTRRNGINGANVERVVSAPPAIAIGRSFAVGASGNPGLHVYDAAGQRWNPLGSASLLASSVEVRINALGHSERAPNTLYGGGLGGLFRSTDAGQMWNKATTSLDNEQIYEIVVSHSNAQNLYVLTSPAGVQYSADGGTTFAPRVGGLPADFFGTRLIIDPDDQSRLYLARHGASPSVYRTFDGGVNWQAADSGIGSNEVWRIAADPDDFATVYAATSAGLYKSTDSGTTWTLLPGSPAVTDVDVDHFDGTHIVRVSNVPGMNGVQRSVDGGQSWEVVERSSFGLSRSVAIDYTMPGSLMTTIDSGGVEVIQIAPDLEITSSSSTIAANSSRNVRVDLRNRGPYAASHVVLTASVPRSITTAQTPRGQCAPIGTTGSVRCDIGVVRADETVAVTFDLPELFSGDADVRFTAGGREPDLNLTNNGVSLAVESQADLGLTLASSAAALVEDQSVTLTLTVTNGDFSPAEGVQVSVQVPPSLQLGAVSPSTTQCAGFANTPGGNLTCSVGALARHSSAEIRVTATARQAGAAVITASAMSASSDPLPNNNSATTTISITSPPPAPSGGGGGGGSLTWVLLLILVGFAGCRRSNMLVAVR
jgi:photosystem II stability/assembly factor-like uncharacterized protein